MSKFFKVFCVFALAVFFVTPAFAEVQNVKISGDLTARVISRDDLDLDKDNAGNNGDDVQNYFMSTAEIQIDADLTDNVSTVISLVNQRDWDDVSSTEVNGATNNDNADFDVLLDLASVTLKEMIYSPLTVTIGRQNIWYGNGFIVGSKLRDDNASITAEEYTALSAFDAITATVDLDPWTIDAVYALEQENTVAGSDDVVLLGLNTGYEFNSYNAEAEAYAFQKTDVSQANAVKEDERILTLGLRGSMEPMSNLTLAAEGAVQYGRYSQALGEARARDGMAADISAQYAFADLSWKPTLALEYIYYSGEADDQNGNQGNDYEGWDPMYRGKFDTAIREFQNVYYATIQRGDNAAATTLDSDSGVTNQHQFLVIGSIKPTDTLTIDGRFAYFTFAEEPRGDRDDEIGTELDLILTYDYTEDVSLGLLTAWFFPGDYWIDGQDDTATDIVGSVKVSF
ncbi:MAG: alginate export family protein [Candidatus Omnitrophica bacterium]|nr:alginate export family protein [Candidatus Omnitrophota bacterium]